MSFGRVRLDFDADCPFKVNQHYSKNHVLTLRPGNDMIRDILNFREVRMGRKSTDEGTIAVMKAMKIGGAIKEFLLGAKTTAALLEQKQRLQFENLVAERKIAENDEVIKKIDAVLAGRGITQNNGAGTEINNAD
jgi:hypothetical protein